MVAVVVAVPGTYYYLCDDRRSLFATAVETIVLLNARTGRAHGPIMEGSVSQL